MHLQQQSSRPQLIERDIALLKVFRGASPFVRTRRYPMGSQRGARQRAIYIGMCARHHSYSEPGVGAPPLRLWQVVDVQPVAQLRGHAAVWTR
jgi:hypothetical protein